MQETQIQSLGWEDPLEKEMATHSSILAWEIPWSEEPSGLQSMGLQRVRHDWAHMHNLLVGNGSGCLAGKKILFPSRRELCLWLGGYFYSAILASWCWVRLCIFPSSPHLIFIQHVIFLSLLSTSAPTHICLFQRDLLFPWCVFFRAKGKKQNMSSRPFLSHDKGRS